MIDVHTHLAAVQRLTAFIEAMPESAAVLQPYIDWHQAQTVVSAHSGAPQPRDAFNMREAGREALEQGLTLGYQKSATGAMEPRPVRVYAPVGNYTHPGGPDIRVDPPYDR